MRIVHLLAPAPYGGLERVVEMLASGQRAAGHDVHVVVSISADPAEHPFVATLRQRQIPVHEIRGSAKAYRAEYRRLREILAQLAPEVLHSHGYRSDVIGGLAARGQRIARVSTAHGFTGGGMKDLLYEWIQRAGWRMHDAVIAVSQPLVVKLTAAGIRPPKLQLIPNGWGRGAAGLSRDEARRTLDLPLDTRLIGWVGRLSREKGADVMVDTVPYLAPGLTAVMVGDGPERAGLEARAAALGVADRIRWLGSVADAGRYFAAFDAFALTSRTEGTPIALFEAMAARVPIVATAVGGVPDVVTANEALLVRSEDPAAAGAALNQLFAVPAETAERAKAAAGRLEGKYGVEAWVRRHDEVYRAARAGR